MECITLWVSVFWTPSWAMFLSIQGYLQCIVQGLLLQEVPFSFFIKREYFDWNDLSMYAAVRSHQLRPTNNMQLLSTSHRIFYPSFVSSGLGGSLMVVRWNRPWSILWILTSLWFGGCPTQEASLLLKSLDSFHFLVCLNHNEGLCK